MNQHNVTVIKARAFGLSESSVLWLGVIYLALMWTWILVLVPLIEFFPVLKQEWIAYIPMFLVPALLLMHFLMSFCTVTLTEEEILLSWFSLPLGRLSPAQLKCFCAVGNEREDVLCLSTRTLEEMAKLEEARLSKNYFSRYEVDLARQLGNPRDILARKYVNRMRRSLLGIFRDRKILLLKMDPVVQHQLRRMYPHLPYKNYTGISNHKALMFWDRSRPPCFFMPDARDRVEIREDGIELRRKEELLQKFLPGSIKTIVRVDIFRGYDKFFPHHLPVLHLSVQAPEEMAAMAKKQEADFLLQVYRHAHWETCHWTLKKGHCCNLLYTEENVTQLKRLFPDAHWIDISASWLEDAQ